MESGRDSGLAQAREDAQGADADFFIILYYTVYTIIIQCVRLRQLERTSNASARMIIL